MHPLGECSGPCTAQGATFGCFAFQGGWQSTQKGRFPALVSIRGRAREHVCFGTVIRKLYILTTAECVERVGPNPIVVIGLHGRDDDCGVSGVEVGQFHLAIFHSNTMQLHCCKSLKIARAFAWISKLVSSRRGKPNVTMHIA